MSKRRAGPSGKTAANIEIEPRPQYTPGSDLTAEERARRLHEDLNKRIETMTHRLQAMLGTTEQLLKQRMDIVPERQNMKQVLPIPDVQLLSQNLAYVKAVDATVPVNQIAIKSILRGLKAISTVSYTEFEALKRDWYEEKIQIISACQREPIINMNWTNIEGLITTPSQRRQAERGFETEAGAVDGVPVSEERKSKLDPKPKPKARGKKPAEIEIEELLDAAAGKPPQQQEDFVF
jgi:hypothetical protein